MIMRINDTGSFMLFTPENSEERTWIEDAVQPEAWQWTGLSLAVDNRFAKDLIEGMTRDGIKIIGIEIR